MSSVRIVISGKGWMKFVEGDKVTYIEADDHSVRLHCYRDCISIRGPLMKIEEKLGGLGFVRVHRSFLVAVDHIREIEDGWITLDDFKETEIPIGIKYEENLMNEIKNRNYRFL